jgi:hypothetical protein
MRTRGFGKRALALASYTTAGAVIAFWTAYWPASAENILTKLNIARQPTPVSDVSNQLNKTDRLPGVSFEERWNAVPVPQATKTRERKTEHEPPQAGERAEKIPFSCELAFSRLVTKGNFSTRCIASITATTRIAAAE